MATVTLKGNVINLRGEIPVKGNKAPDFRYVKSDLSDSNLYSSGKKVKVIIAVPSLETGVCQTETRKFNEKLSGIADIEALVVSKDIPLAMKRFCELEGIKNVSGVSDFRYGDFVKNYNTELLDGSFKGLSARAVFVVDKDNIVQYSELVPEIALEPDYDKVIKAIQSL